MKKIAFIILIYSLLGCKHSDDNKIIDDRQLADMLEQALLISSIDSDEVFLYEKYENQKNADSLIAFYHYGSNIFGYKIKDSIINNVTYRADKLVPKNLNNFLGIDIKYTSDTTDFNKTYTFITEPFFIDDNKLLFFLSNNKNSSVKRWMYFLEKKQQNSFKVVSFFDFQKNKLYMQGNL